MIINLVFDAQAQAAPQSFRDAIQTAADILGQTLTDSITVNIGVGYDEITPQNGSPKALPANESEGGTGQWEFLPYGVLVSNLLERQGDPQIVGALAHLPATFNAPGQTFPSISSAEAKALGMPAFTAIDGEVGFSSTIGPTGLITAGLHELAHALGRSNDVTSAFDLSRYTSLGQELFTTGATAAPAYFSLDGGATALADYGQTSDAADFITQDPLTPHDPFNETFGPLSYTSLSGVDLLQMEALGFHGATVSQPIITGIPGATTAGIIFSNPATYDWGFMTAGPHGDIWHDLGNDGLQDVVGVADFNHDGVLDVALRDRLTGDLHYISLTAAGSISGYHDVGPTSTDYASLGAGDFNGDGVMDVAFRNVTTGDWGFMSVNPGGGETWHAVGPTSIGYAVVGLGDFNGDGATDIAFRNPATGDFGYMAVAPGGAEVWHAIGPTSPAYAAIGYGDFNGDGIPDVAFRDMATGDWGYMSINPGGGETWHAVGATSIQYAAVGSGDYNGDGLTDVAFRDMATGDWGYMTANPGGGETWHEVGATSIAYFAV